MLFYQQINVKAWASASKNAPRSYKISNGKASAASPVEPVRSHVQIKL
jgi:hypothetical protein